jgi:hypothetical protein
MQTILFGRRHLSFSNGSAVHTRTTVTVRANPGEDEHAFTQRLLAQCNGREGTIEIIFRAGVPEYAIITISVVAGSNGLGA